MQIVSNNGLVPTKVCRLRSTLIDGFGNFFFFSSPVCPTCRKRCWLKDVLHIDLSHCIVTYGKKKIENLSAERDRLNDEIDRLKQSIGIVRDDLRQTEYRLQLKQRLVHRLRTLSRRKSRLSVD